MDTFIIIIGMYAATCKYHEATQAIRTFPVTSSSKAVLQDN